MSQKQLNRFAVITKLIDGHITVKEAALCLELSERQIIRLKKGVLNEGPAFLIHKNKGRKPAHAISQDLVQKIVSLKKSNIYQRANFLHFQEILKEYEAISISSQKPSETKKNKPWIPPDSHYYKYGHKLIKKVTFEDSDRDILKMLEDIFLSKYA
ncbi:integrase [Carboxydothermus islandicus]|uniref:Integrase n=1 Tax=Carboxydothermus islandicus TaxID=661089 RepID=A0A1L8D4L6_9THEO|nr:helix-turn-helix domain-containing protein [Carboxydothermus islandicus]GAV26108.1 integrase [Carboxydothermus islandicus]